MKRIAILSAGAGWHVRDLQRAAVKLGHHAKAVDFRRVHASLNPVEDSLAGFDVVLVRTMPPGSLEQVVFRMDVLHRAQARRSLIVNSPAALETCVDKYLASARLEAAGLPTPATRVCQDAESAMEHFGALGGDVVLKPLFGSEGRGMMRVSDPELCWIYRNAAVVIGAGREDFGLTVVEAALEGTPAATIAAGGYLETVSPGINGFHAASETAEALAEAIRLARRLDADACRAWGRAFGRDAHVAQLATVIEEVVQGA